MTQGFDAIIIGTGQAGPPLAGRLTAAGMRVAIVERHLFGGTCVNTGCKPTKTLVASAYAAHLARRAADYGVGTGRVTVDMARVHARSATISADGRAGVEAMLRKMEGCSVFTGHARFEGPRRVRVGEDLLEARRIFINVGGRPAVPDMPRVGDVPFLTSSSLLATDRLPAHLVVVGGSYVGLEFAQMYRRFGSEVTVVEKGERLIAREDADVSDTVRDILEGEGIAVRTGAECIRFARHPDGVEVHVDCTEGSPSVIGSDVLLAVGRQPNTDDLGLEAAGVAMDARGFIEVDEGLQTNVRGIWAMGDCNGRGAFTHTAYNDFEIVAANLLDGAVRKVSDRIPAYALYIDPPLGRVGMGEREAKAAGHRVLIGKRPMSQVGRAVEKDETLGFMKIVADADSRAILGAAILGTGGDEAIHAVLDTMACGGTVDRLAATMHIHPTVAELLPTIAGSLHAARDEGGGSEQPTNGGPAMNAIRTSDGTSIWFKDWGPKDAPAIVFHHGWPLSADDWDNQMMFFLGEGFRVIAHDRRGHGRSSQTWQGNEMDTYAADVAALTDHLDLKGAVHIGHSTGGGEAARYVARAKPGRVSKAVLIGAVPPIMVKSDKNPGGLPIEVFDGFRASHIANRAQFFLDVPSGPFYGYNQPGAEASEGVIRNWWRQGMMGGTKPQWDCIKAFSETDFTEDLKAIDVPVLVMHGTDDQIVPYEDSAPLAVKLLRQGMLKSYEGLPHGMCTTHAEIINPDILAFIRS